MCTFVNLVIKTTHPWTDVAVALELAGLYQMQSDVEHILRQVPIYRFQTISSYHCDCGTVIGAGPAAPGQSGDLNYWLAGLRKLVGNPVIEQVGLFHFWGDDESLGQLVLVPLQQIPITRLDELTLRGLKEHELLQIVPE